MKFQSRGLFAALTLAAATCAAQQEREPQKIFASPQAAITDLRRALDDKDKPELREIFGPEFHDLLTGDKKQDAANARKFALALDEGVTPVAEGDDKLVLEVGHNRWPLPIPLVKEKSGWRFDTAAGKEEIISRNIGKDELHAIGFLETYARRQPPIPGPKPFHGYFFKSLGPDAVVAYPDRWGKSGVMTFVADRDGKVYQRDLGEKTSEIAKTMTGYDRGDGGWSPVTDRGVADQ